MKTILNRWPGGMKKCLTLSYDDGVVEDRQLISILKRHGIRGTFHLDNVQGESRIPTADIADVYDGFEVSLHSNRHPYLSLLSREEILAEVLENRRRLESLVGYPVDGMSYPMGDYDSRVIELLRACGVRYSRTTKATGKFSLPEDWLEWHPSCHHRDCLDTAEAFLGLRHHDFVGLHCLYVWGHSYEFDRNNNWDLIETFCEKMGGREDIWYATNRQIVEYVEALRRVRSSADGSILQNPSAISVWFTIEPNWEPRELKPGETLKI
ncbi:MAG: polysaccharide deacetylase family protein [Phycisphaerae bacterium]|nr:polysaccharide deacetylase family protein [Phycisphaerae bacterium]